MTEDKTDDTGASPAQMGTPDPAATATAGPQAGPAPAAQPAQEAERSPLELACLEKLTDSPVGERVEVRYQSQTYVAWFDTAGKMLIENRGG